MLLMKCFGNDPIHPMLIRVSTHPPERLLQATGRLGLGERQGRARAPVSDLRRLMETMNLSSLDQNFGDSNLVAWRICKNDCCLGMRLHIPGLNQWTKDQPVHLVKTVSFTASPGDTRCIGPLDPK